MQQCSQALLKTTSEEDESLGDGPLQDCHGHPPGAFIERDRSTPEPAGWHNWRWQMQHRIRSLSELRDRLRTASFTEQVFQAADTFPLAITPYYAGLIRDPGPQDPIFRMAVPDPAELSAPSFLVDDPLAENEDMPVPGLVHRYPDRALLIATGTCATYCRHCTRKRVAGQTERCLHPAKLRRAVDYLRAHPEVRDVIVSGGDPFTMTTPVLERILHALRTVPSIDIVRIGTRTPVTLPMRVTPELTTMLRKYHPVFVNTHFNHPRELTEEAAAACTRLVDAGIPVGNQSVLLRGVNDHPHVLEELFRGLLRMRVRPYYLFQCDLVRGVEHFRTPLTRGIEIMEYLRGRLSGLAIPTFVVDAPGGGGKIPLLPNYIVSVSPTHTVLRNYEGLLVAYPEPCTAVRVNGHGFSHGESSPTVWDLATGVATSIEPSRQSRHERRV